ncbi:hypothetical protein FRC00_007123, partial [Tulasnella sp. 408]
MRTEDKHAAKSIIKRESRKYAKRRGVGVLQVSPLLSDAIKLEQRLRQLKSPGLKLKTQNGGK